MWSANQPAKAGSKIIFPLSFEKIEAGNIIRRRLPQSSARRCYVDVRAKVRSRELFFATFLAFDPLTCQIQEHLD